MEEIHEKRYCERCNQETTHVVKEYALEIEYQCQNCHHQEQMVKTFF